MESKVIQEELLAALEECLVIIADFHSLAYPKCEGGCPDLAAMATDVHPEEYGATLWPATVCICGDPDCTPREEE